MTKIFTLLIILVLFSFKSIAQQNPQIRNCHIAGGEFITANIKIGKTQDEIGLCQFDSAYVGAVDVIRFLDSQRNTKPMSFNEYANGEKLCSGQIALARIVDSELSFKVCIYPDQSIMDMPTLITGVFAEQNFKLNTFLGL